MFHYRLGWRTMISLLSRSSFLTSSPDELALPASPYSLRGATASEAACARARAQRTVRDGEAGGVRGTG